MSKEIVKRKHRQAGASAKGGVTYNAPCFGHGHGVHAVNYVGSVGEGSIPWNASSPLAKKEYDCEYKLWGRRVMWVHLVYGDN